MTTGILPAWNNLQNCLHFTYLCPFQSKLAVSLLPRTLWYPKEPQEWTLLVRGVLCVILMWPKVGALTSVLMWNTEVTHDKIHWSVEFTVEPWRGSAWMTSVRRVLCDQEAVQEWIPLDMSIPSRAWGSWEWMSFHRGGLCTAFPDKHLQAWLPSRWMIGPDSHTDFLPRLQPTLCSWAAPPWTASPQVKLFAV